MAKKDTSLLEEYKLQVQRELQGSRHDAEAAEAYNFEEAYAAGRTPRKAARDIKYGLQFHSKYEALREAEAKRRGITVEELLEEERVAAGVSAETAETVEK